MRTIHVNNPNGALSEALWLLKTEGIISDSRNGRVVRMRGPVATTFHKPTERVMFSALRDANPFFHLFEAIWMLAGRKDAASVGRYAAQMSTFADDGQLWGAYGYRWREFFGFDQVLEICERLRANPLDRRCVLTMWAPNGDLVPEAKPERVYTDVQYSWIKRSKELYPNAVHSRDIAVLPDHTIANESFLDFGSVVAAWNDLDAAGWVQPRTLGGVASKDVPCNTHVYFDVSDGELDMTVCNRSNDVVWGAYGANVVHMSFLHEFIAAAAVLKIGRYTQMSNNFHAYIDRPDVQRLLKTQSEGWPALPQGSWAVMYETDDRYALLPMSENLHFPIYDGLLPPATWLREAEEFVDDPIKPRSWRNPFFSEVAVPMANAHWYYKAGNYAAAIATALRIDAHDWRMACVEWLERRRAAAAAKAGV